ncbi:hypothetical protein P8452_02096 [Trifolium repens]|nr:hypothetical protein P8452_02096 [Trifolium repens]
MCGLVFEDLLEQGGLVEVEKKNKKKVEILYNAIDENKIKWHKIQCPRQRNAIDCGYFIMRFMKEVIMEYPNTIPDDYFHRHRHPTYSKEKLDEVKEEWATCMVEDVINDAKRRQK